MNELRRGNGLAFCLAGILLFLFVLERGVKPVSDFALFWAQSERLSLGQPLSDRFMFYQGPGQPNYLYAIRQITGPSAALVAPYLNVLMYLCTVAALWFTWPWATANVPSRFRMYGLLLLLVNGFYLPLLPALASELPFAFCFALAHALIVPVLTATDVPSINSRHSLVRLLRLGLGGACLGLAQAIRPVAVHYVLLLIAVGGAIWLWRRLRSATAGKVNWSRMSVSICVVLVVGFAVSSGCYRGAGYSEDLLPPQRGAASIFSGTHSSGEGKLVSADANYVKQLSEKYSWSPGPIRTALTDSARARIWQHWPTLLTHYPLRLERLVNSVGISSYSLSPTASNASRLVPIWRAAFVALAVVAGLVFLVNAVALAVLLLTHGRAWSSADWVFACVMGACVGYALLHATVLEIAGRFYAHFALLHFWLAPYAWYILRQRVEASRLRGTVRG
jgi:hypothetical protein